MPNARPRPYRAILNPRTKGRGGFVRSARAKGFVILQMIAGVAAAAALVGMLGYTLISAVKSSSVMQRESDTRDLLRQGAYILAAAAANADADDAREPPAGTDFIPGAPAEAPSDTATFPTPVTNDGWFIPKASAAPRLDAWGGYIKYCAWDNGSISSSTGRLPGDATTSYPSAVAFAVISAGLDKTMHTTCVQAKAGTAQGDDIVRAVTNTQIVQSVGGTAYIGDAVANAAALDVLPAVQPGQMRTALDTGTVYVNKTGAPLGWTAVSGVGGGGGGGGTTLSTQPNYASITALTGPISAGQMYIARDTGALYATRVDIPAGQSGQQYWQMVIGQPDLNTAVTIAGGSAFTFLSNADYTANPVTLATGAGGTPPLKYNLSFDTPADASLFFPPLSFSTANSAVAGIVPGSAVPTKQARIVVTDTLGRSASKAITLAVGSAAPTAYVLLTSGTSYTVPANVHTLKIWAVGGGGGGAGVNANAANTAGGGGGAGGVVYKAVTGLSVSGTLTYTVGAGGAGAAAAATGTVGGNSSVTFNALSVGGVTTPGTMIAGGGGGGLSNSLTAAAGGTITNIAGSSGVAGGTGRGSNGNNGGGGGGGIGGAAVPAITNPNGGNGAEPVDVSGLQTAITAVPLPWLGAGVGSTTSTVGTSNGGAATGTGGGGGGASAAGGTGGAGIRGGGGGGAAGYAGAPAKAGGNGGAGFILIKVN